jgi:hypothetical protein
MLENRNDKVWPNARKSSGFKNNTPSFGTFASLAMRSNSLENVSPMIKLKYNRAIRPEEK